MIKFTSKLLYIFASIIVSIQGCDNNPQNIDPIKGFELVALKLENAINYEIKSKNLNAISMVLVDDQKIAWAKGFGYENPDTKINADANTVYRVGSVSKLFTDMAIMQRVEIGEIDLDKAIQTYLPNFKPDNPYKKPITLRQMMSHRSGLLREPRKGNYFTDDEISLKTTVESIIPSKLIHEPESKTKYSNAAIAVVGYTLESLYKTPYVDYMQKHILEKIGMNNSSFAPNTKIRARLAKATMWSYDDRIFSAPTFELGMIPAGSLYAPVTDLAKFMMVLFAQGKGPKEVVIKPETLNEMISPQFGGDKTRGYGIGFGLSEHGGYQKIGHGGAIYGFSTQLYAIPEIKYGVATSSSVDISNSITTKLSNYALDLMLANKNNEPLPDYIKTSQLDAKISQSLKGHYSRGNLYADIELRGPSTVLVINSLEVPLKQSSKGIISDGRIDQGSFKIQKSGEDILVNGKLFTKKVKRKKTQFPNEWKGLVGEYGWDHNILFVYEDMGSLWLLMEWIEKNQLLQVKDDLFAFPENSRMYYGERLKFKRNAAGVATEVAIINGPVFKRREIGASNSETFRIEPLKPIEELRDIAFKAKPPKENQDFLSSDLVELKNIDKTINYDIRYASTNNFMSNKFYTRAEAYLQRPAAQALGRVNKKLKTKGYGLLIHDAYRPWYVTKMFWDATPFDKKLFVANPENGSRHNRGCAIDLTLYDLKSGKVIRPIIELDESIKNLNNTVNK